MNNTEIERKFLVKSLNFIKESFESHRIEQGYLNSHKERTVRIRIKNDQGFLTIKGASNQSGTTRYEWEKETNILEAQELLKLCEPNSIQKTRYLVKKGTHIFEVDVFDGANDGLIVAEVELSNEFENFEKPTWLGTEVTGETKYYNSQLSKHPFKNW